jgi:VWFA-related protein
MRALQAYSSLNSSRAIIFSLPILLMLSPLTRAQAPPGATSGAQAPAAPATQNSSTTPTLSTTVDEVSFDLTVRTKHNKPVLDLESSQLSVTDAGSPVQLSSLRLVAADSGSQHLVTLVFDRLDPGGAKRARAMAEKILGVFPEKGFSFAVLQVSGRLRLLQPYTEDSKLIDAAIADATPATPAPPLTDFTPAEKAMFASAQSDDVALGPDHRAEGKLILSALEESQRILEERHGNPSLAALQALVQSDRLLTGRKFILYFSEGITSKSNVTDISDALQFILGQANRAGVTICVVDASPVNAGVISSQQASEASSALASGGGSGANSFGLGSTPGSTSSSSTIGGPGTAFNLAAVHNTAGFEFGDVDTRESPLAPLATGTGGIYIGDSGAYNHQLQQLHDDLTSWYQASWEPPIKSYNSDFRPIDIHPLRKDVVIRTRSGYFAVPPTEATGVRPFEMPLLNILAGSARPTDVAFHAAILHLGELPDGNASELTVQVPISQLAVHEDANTHISAVHAAIVAIIRDNKGTILQRFGEDFPVHETPDMFRTNSGQTITFEQHFSADPGVYTLETAVMDRIANKAGAQSTTFTVEPPAKGPSLSDVALVESVKPIEEDREAFEPMRFGDRRVVPNLASVLPGDTRSLSLFFLVHPVAGSQSQPALRMQIFRNGELLTEMPMALDKVSGTGAAVPYLGTINGHAFAPGDYQVKTLLSQDGSTASSSTSFRVEGDSTASNSSVSSLIAAGSTSGEGINSSLVSKASTANSEFVVTSPKDPFPPPTDAETQAMIEGARQRALTWSDSLVNFYCYEVTNHSVDDTGTGDWKHKDTLVEQMQYVDHGESRTILMLDGDRSSVQPDQLQFIHSAGEFGAMFQIVFNPSAKAVFTWKQSAFIDGQPVQVFAVKVDRANSGFDLRDRDGHVGQAGFHGLVYLDPDTLGVRRISIDADDIPPAILIRASSMSVDYSWVTMQSNEFLLPVRGAVSVQETKRRPVLNDFEFMDYRRFGSQSRVITENESKATLKQ